MTVWKPLARQALLASILCLFAACESDPPTDPTDTSPPPTDTAVVDTNTTTCGDGQCDANEDLESCPADCLAKPLECVQEVSCDIEPPDCAAPLIAVAKGECWGCGHPKTCTCSDTEPVVCDMMEPNCDEGMELASVGGCFECVNPITCTSSPVTPPPTNKCVEGITCLAAPPTCEAPLIPVAYEDCFGCGYADTCSCSDGTTLTCKMMEPECDKGFAMAIQDGCYECVDPMSCKASKTPPPADPIDTCVADAGCLLTQFTASVASTDDCFCPGCPSLAVNQPTHNARQAAWVEHCSQWAKDQPCPVADCAPGSAICDNNQCIATDDPPPAQCDTNVACDGPKPLCKAPLIPVNKDGCWGCGHPESCTCSDGPATCFMAPPDCAPGLELATIDGCYQCVNPISCVPSDAPPPGDDCSLDVECTITKYKTLVTSVDDCFCPMCNVWPVTKTEHTARQQAWNTICAPWEQQNPCPLPKCANPGTPACENGTCIKIPPPGDTMPDMP